MNNSTLFDTSYQRHKWALLERLLERLVPIYTAEEVAALRIDAVDRDILSERSGRGFVNRDLLETVLGNLLECVAPGSHNALGPGHQKPSLDEAIGEIADQLYAMIAQSLLAAGASEGAEEKALMNTICLLWELPAYKGRARWNRFAALRDPAVWDAYLLDNCGLTPEQLLKTDFRAALEETIRRRDFAHYRRFLDALECDLIFDYQMQLVMSTYPGWRVLFYHDIAHALTRSGPMAGESGLTRRPVPLLPRAIAELGGRYYQADIHPETQIGDANFLDHPHRGITTGQTGIIGSGCHIYPCTLGGLSGKVQQRHPTIGDYVFIGTDAGLFGPVQVGDRTAIGANSEINGIVEIGPDCRIGVSVSIGTVIARTARPGAIKLGAGVRVGAGTVIENDSPLELVIPDQAAIPVRSHVVNDGGGGPKFV